MKSVIYSLCIGFALLAIANSASSTPDACQGSCNQWSLVDVYAHEPITPGLPYGECFAQAGKRYALNPRLLAAIAAGESDFNALAVSSAGAIGVMQIMWPVTARHLGFGNRSKLFEPCQNIHAGARYFRELIDRYEGDTHRALAAYNMGPSRISRREVPDHGVRYSHYIYRRYVTLDQHIKGGVPLFEVPSKHIAARWVGILSSQFAGTLFSTDPQSSGVVKVVAYPSANQTISDIQAVTAAFNIPL